MTTRQRFEEVVATLDERSAAVIRAFVLEQDMTIQELRGRRAVSVQSNRAWREEATPEERRQFLATVFHAVPVEQE